MGNREQWLGSAVEMSAAVWLVHSVSLTADAKKHGWRSVAYPFHVEGVNVANGFEYFSWSVPNLHSPQYGLAHAIIDDDASRALLSQELNRAGII